MTQHVFYECIVAFPWAADFQWETRTCICITVLYHGQLKMW